MSGRLLPMAKKYREKGWNVVPLFDYSKAPNKIDHWEDDFGWLPGWEVFETRMSTDREFSHWFEEKDPTGLGVVTGKISGIVVVDEDSYKENGMKFNLVSPLRAKTGRGGTHHFFKYTDGVKTSGFKQGINIEIKSDGGFIVLPPTQVWLDEAKTQKGVYRWEGERVSLENLPEITEEQLKAYKGTSGNGRVIEDIHELLNSKIGYQHNNLRSLCLSVLNRFQQKEWDIAVQFIREEAKKFEPPHPDYRVEKMIKDCMQFIIDNPRQLVTEEVEAERKSTLHPRSVKQVAMERIAEKELEKRAPLTGFPGLDRLIIGFVPGHLYTLTGETNVGKSSLACNFSERVRIQGKKVLYFALEPENTVVDYLASARTGKKFDELTAEDIMFDDGNISIFGKQEVSNIKDLVAIIRNSDRHYDLVIVDHIGYFIKDKQNTFQDQSNVIKELAGLAKEKGVAIMMIAHLRKRSSAQKKDYTPNADDIAGSGAFKQDSTEVLIVLRDKDPSDPDGFLLANTGMIRVAKTKCGPNGAVPILFSDKVARIFTSDELWTKQQLPQASRAVDELTIMGFPDRDKAKL